MKNYKVYVSWFLVLVWMIVIFTLSSMDGKSSRNLSEGSIEKVVSVVIDKTNDLGLTDENKYSKEKISSISETLNYPIRKLCHFTEYFIFTFLLFNALYKSGIKNKKLYLFSLLFCFLYACSDEIHQVFTGRTCMFSDVLIDTFGGIVLLLLCKINKKGLNSL